MFSAVNSDASWAQPAGSPRGPHRRLHRVRGVPPCRVAAGRADHRPFFNWPQLYLLGGADDLLAESGRHWEGVSAQLTELGMLSGEYERGYDWFHQGESLLLLYFLTMADPARWAEQAVRFAELYIDPVHGNYEPGRRIIRRPHNGSDPGRSGLFDGTHYAWTDQEEKSYGFPVDWLLPPGAIP